jgi:hypothetical protein
MRNNSPTTIDARLTEPLLRSKVATQLTKLAAAIYFSKNRNSARPINLAK